jgi:hypothetical protein
MKVDYNTILMRVDLKAAQLFVWAPLPEVLFAGGFPSTTEAVLQVPLD